MLRAYPKRDCQVINDGNFWDQSMAGNKWQISDELWEKMARLTLEHKIQPPLCTHRKRVDNRAAWMPFSLCSERLPVEWFECYRNMLVKLSPPPLPGVAGCRSNWTLLTEWTACLWAVGCYWLVVAVDGWQHDQITAVWLKKTGRNPTDRGKQGGRAAWWRMRTGCHSLWLSTT